MNSFVQKKIKENPVFLKKQLHFFIVYGIVFLVRIQTMAKEWGDPLFCVYYLPEKG